MNIAEMHVWFRQYAQQMSMQNVRAILPEQIDVFINTAISDIVNQLVRNNIAVTNDKVVIDKSKLNQINSLRSLYKVVELPMTGETPFMEFLSSNSAIGKMSNKQYDGSNVSDVVIPDYLYLVDFSINYKVANTGYSGNHGYDTVNFNIDSKETNYFPIRFIDDAYLADTLNDAILKNKITAPIIVLYNNDSFDLYIDKFVLKDNHYYLYNDLIPYKLRVSYIKTPAKVKYATDIGCDNVDCDLPESIHTDILKYAVGLYNVAINKGYQQQQQTPQDMSGNANTQTNNVYNN